METERLLEIRKRIKSKKPEFIRQDYNKKPGLKRKWRKPKGLHSKVRVNKRGKPKKVSKGYRSPRLVRGLHKTGLEKIRVDNAKKLEGLDNKKHGIVISSAAGKKNRIVILKKAKELGFNVLNIRNPDEYIKNAEQEIAGKKKAKKEEKKDTGKKEPKQEEKEEKSSGKAEGEDKEEVEKKEKEKLLTKRER